MINVRVAQNYGVNLLWVEKKTPIALHRIVPFALEESAFEQQSLAIDFDQILRAGCCASGAEKVDEHFPKV
jgi:hypothetical protein